MSMLLEELKSLGVDVDEGLDRMTGNSALYETVIGMFVDLVNNNPVNPEDFSEANLNALIGRFHMYKGTTGNLAMTPLFKRYTRVLDLLRAEQAAEAREEFERLLPLQVEIVDCIRRHTGG